MPYVRRDENGAISAVFTDQQDDALELLAAGAPDLMAFMGVESDSIRSRLAESDIEMSRVIEDLVDILISRGAILLTDFPAPAQEKLNKRGGLRRRLHDPLTLIDEQDLF